MKKPIIYFGKLFLYLTKWLLTTGILGVLVGSLSAFFLNSLAYVTEVRLAHPWLLLLLPVSGALFAFLYQHYGRNAIRGNNLVIDQGNGGKENIPLRLIPLTFFGTITSHLFGAAVGREGTAVQIGGAIADWIGRLLTIHPKEREILIICGISAGFSSVFGTPLAGTLFGIEVLAIGKIRSEALLPSFFAAFFGNIVTESFNVKHIHYRIGSLPDWSLGLFFKLILAGICFGLLGRIFSRGIFYLKNFYQRIIEQSVLRNFIGGCIVVIAASALNTYRYLGLSLPLLQDAFNGDARWYDFIGKLGFTILSLGAGYQGGEVTPLFEIGATFGATLAVIVNVSIPFFAALGFIGVFSGATNTPIACFIMGVELFGSSGALFFFFVCLISFLFSGNSGIYAAQQVQLKKGFCFFLF